MPSNTELLQLVRTAIKTRLEGGAVEAVSVDGINLRYASVKDLWALEERLQMLARSQAGNRRANVWFGGRV